MGKGNAGLRALTHVRFDVIKLDHQVVSRLGVDPAADATLAAATSFVRATGGWIVAEGIEETVTLDAVLSAAGSGPAAAQLLAGSGYLLGRPAPRPRSLDVPDDLLAPLGGGTWLPDPVERGG